MTDQSSREVEAIRNTLALFKSVIHCGDTWTQTCQHEFDVAWAALDSLAAAQARAPGGGAPAARWRQDGKPDPHGDRYNCERAQLPGGAMFTDDELANAVYLEPNIMNLTAAKERIRWLSRQLAAATRTPGDGEVDVR